METSGRNQSIIGFLDIKWDSNFTASTRALLVEKRSETADSVATIRNQENPILGNDLLDLNDRKRHLYTVIKS